MRLLRAELGKLRRPLVLWTMAAVVGLVGLLSWSQQRATSSQFRITPNGVEFVDPFDSCAGMGLAEGPQCDELMTRRRADFGQYQAEARAEALQTADRVKLMQHPLGAGRLVAGLLASAIGAAVAFLLAAGHVGHEWSGRTIKMVLAQDGRRWRFLAAKAVSLWLCTICLLLVSWGALAALSPLFRATNRLPGPPPPAAAAWGEAWPQAGRALLVLLAFSVIGILAAVVTRNTLGAFFLALTLLVASLVTADIGVLSRVSPAYWVSGWMGFQDQGVLDHVWTDTFPAGVPSPGRALGLLGLLGLVTAAGALALVRVQRSDVTT